MNRAFDLIILFILIVFLINSYFLSVKQNFIKITSFLFRLIFSWVLAKNLASLIINTKISNKNYEYKINGEVIHNIVDIFKVLLIKNFPELSYIINERIIATYIIESISIMFIRTIMLILIYILITFIYKLTMYIIKKLNKKKEKVEEVQSKKRGLIFGALQGFLVIFLISIPFSGISSLANELVRLDDNLNNNNEITFLKDYRKTKTGKFFTILNINKKPIDMYFFDKVFSIEIDNSTLYISDEVRVYVDIIEIIEERDLNNLDLNSVDQLDEDFIRMLTLKLKEAKSLNLSIPLLIDYFLINELEINLDDGLYDVDYYNECTYIGDLFIYYLNEKDNFKNIDLNSIDAHIISSILTNLSNLDLLDKLSEDISYELLNNENIKKYLIENGLDNLSLNNVNYKKEVTIIKNIFNKVFEVEEDFNSETIEALTILFLESDFLKDNNEIFINYLIDHFLYEYSSDINRLPLKEDDIRSFLIIAKAYVDNGYLEPFFRLSKLYDEKTINILIEAIGSSDLLRNNLSLLMKLFLKEAKIELDINLIIPDYIDFKSEEGKRELRELLRLFQIMNYGIKQENLEKHLDEICDIIENSSVIKANINNIINWVLNKYNTTNYEIFITEIDFNSHEGEQEIKSLIKILRLLVNKKVLENDLVEVLKLSKEDIDILFSSKIIEEASIHLIYDLGQDENIPLVVNYEVDDPLWYKQSRSDGELRNLIYAIRIIFKDVKKFDDIKFTPELILSIDDGTIDTNGDGVVNKEDENELKEIMESKILSDSIIKFLYDYYKDMYNK